MESPMSPAHTTHAVPLGTSAYSSGVALSLARRDAVLELVISDTGRFDIPATRGPIVHHTARGVERGAVALDLIGVVLPLAFHRDGAWCVHASAVETPAGVIAFVASRGTGKSTLAASCVQRGCALVADDVVVLRQSAAGVTVTPSGLPLRVGAATARALGVPDAGPSDAWGKVQVAGQAADRVLPLAALYVLHAAAADAPVQRAPRAPRDAALAMLANGKITELLGTAEVGETLARCATLAGTVPCYDLAVPRALERLESVTTALLAWHDGSPMVPTA